MDLTTISFEIDSNLLRQVDDLVFDRASPSRDSIIVAALKAYIEKRAINAVLEASNEARSGAILRGSAREVLFGV